jgi:hypothetical protein
MPAEVPMFKVRSVVLWLIAAAITGFVQYNGLDRLHLFWSAHAGETTCPPVPPSAPAVVLVPAATAATTPSPDPRIGVLTVGSEGAELFVGDRRSWLPGYPFPRKDHTLPLLTMGVVAPGGDLIALAGMCYGESGVAEPQVPSCAPTFVRLYRADDGAHVRDLRVPWRLVDDNRRVLAMAFDASGERLAVLLEASWSDCSWEGDGIELVVYRLSDGARLAHRDLEAHATGARNEVRFHDDEVRVTLGQADGRPKLRVVRLRKPKAA